MTDTHARAAFSSRVLSIVRRIPPGRVVTDGDVAALAGRPRAARAVGNVM
ncbi:MAG: MGMT family protein, partial [Acidobacteria bacterium]|nr:MGMT family protein [Acidobacteriota bacterium]